MSETTNSQEGGCTCRHVRYRLTDTPLPPGEAAQEKAAGSERLKSLKAMLAR